MLFRSEKPEFREPNLINLNILDEFLTPQFLSEYNAKKPAASNKNPALGLSFIGPINNILSPVNILDKKVKPLYCEKDKANKDVMKIKNLLKKKRKTKKQKKK